MPLDAANEYSVEFRGVNDKKTLELLQSASQMVSLQNTPPSTPTALKRRAEADVPNFIKVLHSRAYYNGRVSLSMDLDQSPIQIIYYVETGPVYPFAQVQIIPASENCSSFPYNQLSNEALGIVIGQPAYPEKILDAEEKMMTIMESRGYPLAQIKKREVVADQTTKSIIIKFIVESGPPALFGLTTIESKGRIDEEFVRKKIAWREGEPYDPAKVERTQLALEATGLFNSIEITHSEEAPCGMLPIVIRVIEGKHRSIGAGVSYSTEIGPGMSLEWEHRNIGQQGQKLSLKADIAQKLQEGSAIYVIPDFKRPGQDLLWMADIMHQTTKGFDAFSMSGSGIIERQIDERTRISYGGSFKHLRDYHSDNNNEFNLLKGPFQLRWADVDRLLDPSYGMSLHLRVVPTLQAFQPSFFYVINTLSGTVYFPLTKDERVILAGKATLGTIVGSPKHSIPPSERFYAGTESLLRGYHYLTVSPINHHDHKPTGGRSMMIYSLETRLRATERFGWVFFYDFGNVYATSYPKVEDKILQSIGFGLRYNTPVGPLRFDLAFPLNPRRHIDERFQLYLSIGQAF